MSDRRCVYVLSSGAHEDWTLLGIYSTLERAESAKAFYERPHKVEWMDYPHRRQANPIQEIPLDRAWADGPQDWPLDLTPESATI